MTTLIITMRPHGKARARVTKDGHAYTPKTTVQAESDIGKLWLAMRGDRFGTSAVTMKVVATFKSGRRNPPAGTPHTQRPDGDNVYKLCADALNGIAYLDDAQIADGRCIKVWGDVDSLCITVEELSW